MKIIIISGNPPSQFHYSRWKDELQNKYSKDEVLLLTPDLSIETNCSEKFFQLVSKSYIKMIRKIEGPVCIVSHSIGSYFAILAQQELGEKVVAHLQIYPFLNPPLAKGEKILKLLRGIYQRPFLSKMTLSLLGVLSFAHSDLKRVTRKEKYDCLKLANHEFVQLVILKKGIDFSDTLKERMHFFWSEGDNWCHEDSIEILKSELPSTKVQLRHDFVVSSKARQKMNNAVLKFINSI